MNPEFRRNVWIHVTPHRLVGIGLVLAASIAMAAASGGAGPVASTALLGFFTLALAWGTRQAADSVASEIRDRTWDWQRGSALTAWQLAWGKLFGATAIAWYGGAICLVAFHAAAPQAPPFGADFSPLPMLVSMVIAALLGQAAALLLTLFSAESSKADAGPSVTASQILGIALGALAFRMMSGDDVRALAWYGLALKGADLSLLFFCVLAVLLVWGIERLMRGQLGEASWPVAWPAFLAWLLVFALGFRAGSAIALPLLAAAAWLHMLMEPKSIPRLRRALGNALAGRGRAFLADCPSFIASLPVVGLALAFYLARVLTEPVDPGALVIDLAGEMIKGVQTHMAVGGVALAVALLRDMGLVLFFNLAPHARRPDMTAAIWLSVLWLVLPVGLVASAGGAAASFFLPTFGDHAVASLVSLATQAAIFWALAAARWRATRPAA